MSKLTEQQRRDLKQKLTAGENPEELKKEFGIKERQMQYYLKDVGLSKSKGKPTKEHNILQEKIEEDEDVAIEMKEPSKTDLLENHNEQNTIDRTDAKTDLPIKQELDENKDYCAECHRQGRIVELQKNQTICSQCGEALNW